MIKTLIVGEIFDPGYLDNFLNSYKGYCANLFSEWKINLYSFMAFSTGTLQTGIHLVLITEGKVKDILYIDNFISSTKSRLDTFCKPYDFYVDIDETLIGP